MMSNSPHCLAIEPCKCGSTEHSRISSKACPFYKPPPSQMARIQGVKEVTRVTKLGFKRFLAEPALALVIEDAVKRMTYISFEASRLANMYIIYLLENDISVPELDYNSFMRLPFQAVIRTSPNNPAPKNTSNHILNQIRDTVY